MNLGVVLKKYRLMMDLSLADFGKIIGISAPTLMRLEKGHDPDVRTLKKILDWLFQRAKK